MRESMRLLLASVRRIVWRHSRARVWAVLLPMLLVVGWTLGALPAAGTGGAAPPLTGGDRQRAATLAAELPVRGAASPISSTVVYTYYMPMIASIWPASVEPMCLSRPSSRFLS